MEALSRHRVMIRGTLVILALVLLCLSAAAYAVNHSRLHDLLVQQLKTQLGIEVSTLRLRLFPTASIEVSDVLVRDAEIAEPSLQAGHAVLSIRLWPLMTRRALVLTLDATEPEVVIRRDETGRWHLPLLDDDTTAPPPDAPPDAQPDAQMDRSDRQWSVTGVILRDGTLRILDPARLVREGIAVHHVQATLNTGARADGARPYRANIVIHGVTDDGGDLDVAGTFASRGTDPSQSGLGRQFTGTVRFHNWNPAYWLERAGQHATAYEAATERGTLAASLRIDFPTHNDGCDGDGCTVIFSDVKADMGWLAIVGDVLISGAGTEQPAYAMALSTSPVRSDTLLMHIPSSWVPQQVQAAMREHKLTGTIELQSAALRGRMDVLRAPDEWRVAAAIADASGSMGKTAVIRKLSGTVLLGPKRAEVTQASGEVNGVHLTTDQLVIDDLDVRPTLEARVRADGKIEQAIPVLDELTQGTEGQRPLHMVSHAAGHLRMAVHLAGPLSPKPAVHLIRGEMTIDDGAARFDTGLSVRDLSGVFEADPHMLMLKHLAGSVQGIHFQAHGNIGLEPPTRVNELQIVMSSDASAVQELLTAHLPPAAGLRLDGAVHSTVFLSGTLTAVHGRGMINLTESEVSMPAIVHKQKGVAGLVEWEGKLFDKTRLVVDRLHVGLSRGEVRAAGQIDLSPLPRFRWHVEAGPFSLRELVESGMKIPLTDGIVHTSAAITGEGTNWKTWLPSGSVTIRRGAMALPGLAEHVSDLDGRLRFTPQGVHLDRVSFRLGENDVKLTGTVDHWQSQPRARLMVESSQLDVSRLVQRQTSDATSSSMGIQEWIQSKEAAISFLVKQLRYERLVLKTVSGEMRVHGQTAVLNDLRAETPKGVLAGRVEARFAADDRVDLAAHLSVDGIPAQHLIPKATGGKEALQGDLSMDGTVHARMDRQSRMKDTVTTGPDGIVVTVKNGRLQHDPVLTKTLKILNLPAVLLGQVDVDDGGIPFQSLSARVMAHNGVLSSEDIVFDSPVIKVAGAGSANIGDNALDLALAVSPVASYSEMIAKIPLFGSLIVGDHSGLTTAVFQAKGSLGNPDVAYLPFQSITRAVSGYPQLALDVLAHAIKLPPDALAFLAE